MLGANGIWENHWIQSSVNKIMKWRPQRGSGSQVQYIGYSVEALCNDIGDITIPKPEIAFFFMVDN